MKQIKRGPGQPRKEPTVVKAYRVPKKVATEFDKKTKALINQLKEMK